MIGTTSKIITFLAAQDRDIEWQIKRYKKGRTLNQNALYWSLLEKLAQKLRMSKNEMHNRIMRDYGTVETFGGQVARLPLPDTEETEQKALRSETTHLRPTAQTKTLGDGVTYRTYVLLKPSHDMTTEEFSALVDGLIEECKAQDIETISPDELAHIRSLECSRANEQKRQTSRAV